MFYIQETDRIPISAIGVGVFGRPKIHLEYVNPIPLGVFVAILAVSTLVVFWALDSYISSSNHILK